MTHPFDQDLTPFEDPIPTMGGCVRSVAFMVLFGLAIAGAVYLAFKAMN